jgi:hypothetical protein
MLLELSTPMRRLALRSLRWMHTISPRTELGFECRYGFSLGGWCFLSNPTSPAFSPACSTLSAFIILTLLCIIVAFRLAMSHATSSMFVPLPSPPPVNSKLTVLLVLVNITSFASSCISRIQTKINELNKKNILNLKYKLE